MKKKTNRQARSKTFMRIEDGVQHLECPVSGRVPIHILSYYVFN